MMSSTAAATISDCLRQHQNQEDGQLEGPTTTTTQQQNNDSGLCACSNILIMQLFHELKAKFPTVPDDVVRKCTDKYYHDRDTCISVLNAEQERIPRGLPYPPGLMVGGPTQLQSLRNTNPRPCTNCGMLSASKLLPLNFKHEKCSNNIDKLLVETKDKLNKVSPNNSDNNSVDNFVILNNISENKKFVKKMKHSKFYVTSENNNIEPVGKKLDEIINNKTVKSGKKFNIKHKVGKYAGRLSKKLDFTKNKSEDIPEIRTHEAAITDNNCNQRFSGGDLFVNVNSGSVGYSVRNNSKFLDALLLIDNTKIKSQSMDCLNIPDKDPIKEKASSLQDINNTEPSERLNHLTLSDDNDGDTIEMILPKSPFGLSKSTRLTNFKPGDTKAKPPLPAKPITPKKPERKKISSPPTNFPETLSSSTPIKNETESSSIPKLNVNQKPPLPKRPTTLSVLPAPSQMPASNNVSSFTPSPTSVNVSLNVNVDVIPSPPQRTVLNLNPELGWLPEQSPRSFTSVNLTLRTPTSEPQAPIDIGTSNSGLTYSSSSFDPRKGFQSSVQITVGPAGRTVSAIRTRPRSSYTPEIDQSPIVLSPRAGSLPDIITPSISNLIKRQLERKERLRLELISEKRKLALMQQEVNSLEALPQPVLTNTTALSEDIRIHREIRHLQMKCKQLADEVDRRSYSRAPLGETNEEFYQNIYTGQRFTLGTSMPIRRTNSNRISDPLEGGPPWTCQMCTFSNHPLLTICEQCGMIRRIRRVTASPGDNIQIHVRPGSNRRVLRSWVV